MTDSIPTGADTPHPRTGRLDQEQARAAITRWNGYPPPELDGSRGLLNELDRCIRADARLEAIEHMVKRYEASGHDVLVRVSAIRELLGGDA